MDYSKYIKIIDRAPGRFIINLFDGAVVFRYYVYKTGTQKSTAYTFLYIRGMCDIETESTTRNLVGLSKEQLSKMEDDRDRELSGN